MMNVYWSERNWGYIVRSTLLFLSIRIVNCEENRCLAKWSSSKLISVWLIIEHEIVPEVAAQCASAYRKRYLWKAEPIDRSLMIYALNYNPWSSWPILLIGLFSSAIATWIVNIHICALLYSIMSASSKYALVILETSYANYFILSRKLLEIVDVSRSAYETFAKNRGMKEDVFPASNFRKYWDALKFSIIFGDLI